MPSILNATTTSGLVTSADNSGSLQLQTNNGTTAVTIDTSQNVGIGIASPTTKLDVNGTAKATTVQATTLSDGTNSTSSTNCIQGSAKAWIKCSGTSTTINASYNVSSITIPASGQITVNLTNALADTNYAIIGLSTPAEDSTQEATLSIRTYVSSSSFTLQLQTRSSAISPTTYCIAVFR